MIQKCEFRQFRYRQCCSSLLLIIFLCTIPCSLVFANAISTGTDHALSNQYALVKEKVGIKENTQFEESIPQTIEFKRINPTKYRVELHHVRDNFNLVFNERYDKQWKAYVVPKEAENLGSSNSLRNNLCMERGRSHDLRTDLTRAMVINPSRNVSIENERLTPSYFWETWLSHNLVEKDQNSLNISKNSKLFSGLDKVGVVDYLGPRVVEWPEAFHGSANMFANGWLFDLSVICSLPKSNDIAMGYYIENTDNTIDIDLVIEYKPQRFVYLAYMLSLASIILSLVMLVLWRKTI